MQRFDLIVIGGGPAGYHAALYAAAKGMSVLLAEARALGGVCLNEGCVPTKCFLYSAKMLRHVKEANRYGVVGQEGTPVLDQNAVRLRKNKAVKRLTLGVRNSLKQAGVTVWTERAELQGKSEAGFVVAAGDTEAEGRFVLIATGSSPVMLPIEGLAAALERGEAMTSAEALELTEIPARLLVIGGGVIGLEMAAYFAEAGSAVTVAEAAPAIAGRSDADIARYCDKTQKNFDEKGNRIFDFFHPSFGRAGRSDNRYSRRQSQRRLRQVAACRRAQTPLGRRGTRSSRR